MKKIRILQGILTRTHTDKLLISYVLFVFADALFIWLVDPAIQTYGDALWYCYTVLSTVGFGDITVSSLAAKLASVLLTVYSLFALAILTGVTVNFVSQLIQIQQKDTLAHFIDKLEQLPELSDEELKELSRKVTEFRSKLPDYFNEDTNNKSV